MARHLSIHNHRLMQVTFSTVISDCVFGPIYVWLALAFFFFGVGSSSLGHGFEKFAIPRLADQLKAEKRLRAVLVKGKSTRVSPDKAGQIASQLFALQKRTTDVSEKWVLGKTAVELLSETGNVHDAHAALDMISSEFRIDLIEHKTEAIESAFRRGKNLDLQSAIKEMLESCFASDNYGCFNRSLNVGFKVARRARDKTFLDYMEAAKDLGVEGEKRHLTAISSRQMLAINPLDPDLNRKIGEHLCFWKDQWDVGLKYLAKARGTNVSKAAAIELRKSVDESDLLLVASLWMEMAGKSTSTRETRNLYLHAAVVLERLLAKSSTDEKMAKRVSEQLTRLAVMVGIQPDTDVALASLGAKVGGAFKSENHAIDGVGDNEKWSTFKLQDAAIFELGQIYALRRIDFRLYDADSRFFRYQIHTSIDGREYRLLEDRSKGEWRGWQKLSFQPRLVKFIRVTATYCSNGNEWYVIELIAK